MTDPEPGAAKGSAGDQIDVSIVIVVYRTPEYLRRCLDSIAAAAPKLAYEICVLDNAPLDRASEQVAAGRPFVRYVRNEENVGFGRAVNQGIAAGGGRYYLVLNPDIEVERGSIEALVALADREEDIGLTAPRLHYADGSLQLSARTFYTLPVFLLRRTFVGKLFPRARALREHLMLDWDHETTRDVDWCIGAALLARRPAVQDVGPMDERFFLYFEDVDWCYRMHQRGWRVVYHPEARMVHHYQRQSAGFWPKRGLWIHLGSTVLFYEKWSFLLYWLKLRKSALRRVLLAVSDLVAVSAAFFLAYYLRALLGGLLEKPLFAFAEYRRFFLFSVGTAELFFLLSGLYRERLRPSFLENLLPVSRALGWTSVLMMASTFLFSVRIYSRAVVLLFLPLAVLLVTSLRTLWLHLLDRMRRHDLNLHRVGVVGPPDAVAETVARFARENRFGMEVVPLLPPTGSPEPIPSIVRRVRLERVQETLVFEEWNGDLGALLAAFREASLRARLVPRARALLPADATLTSFAGWPAIDLEAKAGGGRRGVAPRLWDSAVGLALLLLLFFPFLGAWLARRASGKAATEPHRVRGPNGALASWRRLTGADRGRGFTAEAIALYPTLPALLSGKASLVGLYPIPDADWSAVDPAYRAAPPALPLGLFGPWTAAPVALDEAVRWNRLYGRPWSGAEDLRILGRALRGTD